MFKTSSNCQSFIVSCIYLAPSNTHTHTHVMIYFRISQPVIYHMFDGFRDLVVSMLASGTQVCGFKPGRSRWIFTGIKILSIPSSGGEVKESVPCPSFAACQRTQ